MTAARVVACGALLASLAGSFASAQAPGTPPPERPAEPVRRPGDADPSDRDGSQREPSRRGDGMPWTTSSLIEAQSADG